MGQLRFCSYPETRQLARYGGNRAQCPERAMPEQEDRQYRDRKGGSPGMVRIKEQHGRKDQLAVHHQGIKDKT